MMRDDWLAMLAVLVMIATLSLLSWETYARLTYPCEAFRSGYMSLQGLPGRCAP